MDSYKKDNEGTQAPKPRAGTARLGGTGQLNMDAFTSSGTAPLNRTSANGTRKLSTGSIEMEKLLNALTTEVENGSIIIAKLESRIAVLKRALQIVDRPIDLNKICAGISPGEANFTKQVAQQLQRDPAVMRRVQVAVYQFDQAHKGLQQASEVLENSSRYEGAAKGQYLENNCHVEKLRGQLYPLINLHVVFRDNPLLAQLIPAPRASEEAAPPPPPPPSPPQPTSAAKPATGPLNDPAVQQMVETLNKVTGNLKGLLGFKKK